MKIDDTAIRNSIQNLFTEEGILCRDIQKTSLDAKIKAALFLQFEYAQRHFYAYNDIYNKAYNLFMENIYNNIMSHIYIDKIFGNNVLTVIDKMQVKFDVEITGRISEEFSFIYDGSDIPDIEGKYYKLFNIFNEISYRYGFYIYDLFCVDNIYTTDMIDELLKKDKDCTTDNTKNKSGDDEKFSSLFELSIRPPYPTLFLKKEKLSGLVKKETHNEPIKDVNDIIQNVANSAQITTMIKYFLTPEGYRQSLKSRLLGLLLWDLCDNPKNTIHQKVSHCIRYFCSSIHGESSPDADMMKIYRRSYKNAKKCISNGSITPIRYK